MAKRLLIALSALLVLGPIPALADAVADFYKGKQIRVIVRTLPGGDYDQLSRILARFMGKYIPGNPSMVVVNMTGGGGIVAANYMAEVAPKDGTVIGIVSQGLAVDQSLGMSKGLKADLAKFGWIANVVYSNQLLVVWHGSPTKTLEDAKKRETTIGATGVGSVSVQIPTFLNNVYGTKFKVVYGYRGGQLIDVAMERGEVEGRGANPYSGWMSAKPTWIPEKKIIPLVQLGMEKEPALPNVPLIVDLKVKAEDKPLLAFMGHAADVGRPLATTPGVPAERLAALRKAFMSTVKDPDFIKEAKKQHLTIRPMTAERMQGVIFGILNAPDDIKKRMKMALQPKSTDAKKLEGAGDGKKKKK
jgi:tripartite-type tricarboxylate transporter receptor subunit TctC